jgi:hypothetical protein
MLSPSQGSPLNKLKRSIIPVCINKAPSRVATYAARRDAGSSVIPNPAVATSSRMVPTATPIPRPTAALPTAIFTPAATTSPAIVNGLLP